MVVFSRFARYFEEVARRGSIRGAGDHAHIASSAINRQILNAEDELGVPLFERHTSGMRLTAAGEVLVYHLRRWQQEFDNVCDQIEDLHGMHGGRITFGVAEGTIGSLSAILADFKQHHPRALVTVKVAPGSAIELLLSGEADVCLTYRQAYHRGLRIQHSQAAPLGVIMPPAHPLAARKSLRLKDIVDEPAVMLDKQILTQDRLAGALDKLGLTLRTAMVVDSFHFLRLLVQRGVGIGFIVPVDCMEECEQGKLVFVPLEDPELIPLELSLITSTHPTPTIIRFCQYVTERLLQRQPPAPDFDLPRLISRLGDDHEFG